MAATSVRRVGAKRVYKSLATGIDRDIEEVLPATEQMNAIKEYVNIMNRASIIETYGEYPEEVMVEFFNVFGSKLYKFERHPRKYKVLIKVLDAACEDDEEEANQSDSEQTLPSLVVSMELFKNTLDGMSEDDLQLYTAEFVKEKGDFFAF